MARSDIVSLQKSFHHILENENQRKKWLVKLIATKEGIPGSEKQYSKVAAVCNFGGRKVALALL